MLRISRTSPSVSVKLLALDHERCGPGVKLWTGLRIYWARCLTAILASSPSKLGAVLFSLSPPRSHTRRLAVHVNVKEQSIYRSRDGETQVANQARQGWDELIPGGTAPHSNNCDSSSAPSRCILKVQLLRVISLLPSSHQRSSRTAAHPFFHLSFATPACRSTGHLGRSWIPPLLMILAL